MTPDAKAPVASVESYKAVAPPPAPPLHAFTTNKYKIVDGIVPDPRTGVILAGPNAKIPPPASMAAANTPALSGSGGGGSP